MRKDNQKPERLSSAENNAEVELWVKKVQRNCVSEITNTDLMIKTIIKCREAEVPLPMILTLCPAIFNLNFPTSKGQTRELVTIQPDNHRVKSLFEEIFGFQVLLKEELGLNTEMFIVFADLLERDAEKMLANHQEINSITQNSIKSIREIISGIDQSTGGLFQKLNIKVPKIRLQSNVSQQGGKVGLNRDTMINRLETKILDPNSDLFSVWTKHLSLARNDAKFTETSWQGSKSAESIWSRMRFLIAELTTDGLFLPEIMKHLTNQRVIEPMFLNSSTRSATLIMESDCFNIQNDRVLFPAFRNIGKWLEPHEQSPWIDELNGIV